MLSIFLFPCLASAFAPPGRLHNFITITLQNLFLAAWAIDCAAACKPDFFKFPATMSARLFAATINGKAVLESAGIAIGITIIPYGAAALFNGLAQHSAHGAPYFTAFFRAEAGCLAQWAYSGHEQKLVSIYVANARYNFLIKQGAFYRSSAFADNPAKVLPVNV